MRILLSLTALLFASTAAARCMSRYMSYWPPPNARIGTQPVILIEGMGGHQATVKGLRGASLVAPGHRVALNKIATHVGAFRVTQTVWTPKEALRPGTTYTLVVQGKSKTWRPSDDVGGSSDKARHTYTVTEAPQPALAWTGAPSLGEGSVREFGCGPSIHQAVALPTTRDGLVEVTLTRAAQARTYVLPVRDGTLSLGHGMCSGAFGVGGAGERVATFALINDAKTSPGAAQTLTFLGVTGE